MAHTFQIPVSFEFRKVRVKWRERESRIVGLSFQEVGGGWGLSAQAIGRGRKAVARLLANDVPARLWKQCSETVDSIQHERDWPKADEAIERICSIFRPRLLVSSIENDSEEKNSVPADAWQLRESFLRVTHDPKNVLEFLNQWGRWQFLADCMLLDKLLSFQDVIRHALLSSPEEWLTEHIGYLDIETKSEYPYFTLDTVECEPAIRATVTIDLLRQVKFETCARPDCGQPFPIISKHKRKYCSQYCGHLESVRRGRAM